MASSTEGSSRRDGDARTSEGRDFWDYAGILARPLTAFLEAIVVATMGYVGNRALESQQDTRPYTELLSNREEAESNLRISMFTEAFDEFFAQPADTARLNPIESIDARLLRLEMLALNFGESLTLSPLFMELDRDRW